METKSEDSDVAPSARTTPAASDARTTEGKPTNAPPTEVETEGEGSDSASGSAPPDSNE